MNSLVKFMDKNINQIQKKAHLLKNLHDTSETNRKNGPVFINLIKPSDIFSDKGPWDLGMLSDQDQGILKRRSVTSSQTLRKV